MGATTLKSAASPAARPATRLIPCQVNVTTASGDRHSYTALHRSTCGAAIDAFERFGFCKVSVRAAR
ncbi:hypothetical protein PIGHUM_04448 [Pigmentiphaga humi]|uniref:Uncharacterized protein n=1 Tax=Pigmentiphaga humi TaxID=2478468 RepID=A0A3P4B7S7_9BURK|nr:hypothetical protein PIGHUM_04448 [Pigmentiphaga humi]